MESHSLSTDMDFEFFEKLSLIEAEAFLSDLLAGGTNRSLSLSKELEADGIRCDFSIPSLAPVLTSLLPKLVKIPLEPDLKVPTWIRNSETYKENLFDFDDASKRLVLGAAYYLGETFVRSFPVLHWTTGNPETALMNMPVVAGFRNGVEMAPMLVAENLLMSVLIDPSKQGDIEMAVSTWKSKVPQTNGGRKQAKGRE